MALGLMVTALELAAGKVWRAPLTPRASVADVDAGRGVEPGAPTASELDDAGPQTSPVLTY
jgi:hypothetical protein